ncbi:MAG TPA: twin-arginine translocase TatA/TatE family subunit [Myxococcaceae bacterium]|nr:twin-arginine translocase TatA/TatE family subunit [Myxococcaceae bacterium]
MFNLGAGEIAVIAVLALLLLGPERLPELARGLGKFFREFRKQTDEVRGMVEREFYRMDQDVLKDVTKPEANPEPPSRSRLLSPPLREAIDQEPRILPQPTFPAFPAPEGVVPSRPPEPEAGAAATAEPVATAPPADAPAAPPPQTDGPPGRDA